MRKLGINLPSRFLVSGANSPSFVRCRRRISSLMIAMASVLTGSNWMRSWSADLLSPNTGRMMLSRSGLCAAEAVAQLVNEKLQLCGFRDLW